MTSFLKGYPSNAMRAALLEALSRDDFFGQLSKPPCILRTSQAMGHVFHRTHPDARPQRASANAVTQDHLHPVPSLANLLAHFGVWFLNNSRPSSTQVLR